MCPPSRCPTSTTQSVMYFQPRDSLFAACLGLSRALHSMQTPKQPNNTNKLHISFFLSHLYLQFFQDMPDLPPEIWTVIAKLLKREPPPAGQPANWDTHLHQQDLVSLQRVDKVSPSQTEWAHRCLLCFSVQSAADNTRGYTRSYPPYSTKPQWSKISASFSRASKILSSDAMALVVYIGISLVALERTAPAIVLYPI